MMEKVPGYNLPFLRNGIAQIAIIVEDLDTAVERYWHVFGVGPWHIYTYGAPLLKSMSYAGEPAQLPHADWFVIYWIHAYRID